MLTAVLCNKYSFCCIRGLTPFCPKANSRENRFFAARLAIGDENGAHSVKIYANKLTKASPPTSLQKVEASPPNPLQRVKASPPTPLQGVKASPPAPLQGERGVICVVGWQWLTPNPSPKGESLTPDPSPRGEGGVCVVGWQGLTPGDAKRVAVCLKRALVWWPTIYIMVSAMHFAVTDNTCLFGLVCRS